MEERNEPEEEQGGRERLCEEGGRRSRREDCRERRTRAEESCLNFTAASSRPSSSQGTQKAGVRQQQSHPQASSKVSLNPPPHSEHAAEALNLLNHASKKD